MLLISICGRSGRMEQLYRYKVSEIIIDEMSDGYASDEIKIKYTDGRTEVIEDFVTLEVL